MGSKERTEKSKRSVKKKGKAQNVSDRVIEESSNDKKDSGRASRPASNRGNVNKRNSMESIELDAVTPEGQEKSQKENGKIEGQHTTGKLSPGTTTKKENVEDVSNRIKNGTKKVRHEMSNAKIQKTLKKAQDKTTGPKKRISADSTDEGLFRDKDDDDLVDASMADSADTNDFLTDRSHRADLNLVKNKDNDGDLFVVDCPFWKSRDENDEMPMMERKALSHNLKEFAATHRSQLTNRLPIPKNLDAFLVKDKLAERNRVYFTEDQVKVNTIRSIAQADAGEASSISKSMSSKRKVKNKDKKKKEPKLGKITEPTTAIIYGKYEVKKRETVPFSLTGLGVCKKQTKKGAEAVSPSDSSSSISSKTNKESATNSSVSPPSPSPKVIVPRKAPSTRKKISTRKGASKRN